jgi:Fe-S cluster biosynthesis and repair protein YggX
MSNNEERIAQFRKMATDDPENELAHYRLGGLLQEDKRYDEAIESFRRTLELSPQFSKVYSLLAQCLVAKGETVEAVKTLQTGYAVADERGDHMPREEMSKLLVQLGQPAPQSKRGQAAETDRGGVGGFRCARPTCMAGGRAVQLPRPPMNDDLGKQIHAKICNDCWTSWLKDYSIKVINELRLDLSRDDHQTQYDRYMLEFLGLDEQAPGASLNVVGEK